MRPNTKSSLYLGACLQHALDTRQGRLHLLFVCLSVSRLSSPYLENRLLLQLLLLLPTIRSPLRIRAVILLAMLLAYPSMLRLLSFMLRLLSFTRTP